jgi:hypothetical protein
LQNRRQTLSILGEHLGVFSIEIAISNSCSELGARQGVGRKRGCPGPTPCRGTINIHRGFATRLIEKAKGGQARDDGRQVEVTPELKLDEPRIEAANLTQNSFERTLLIDCRSLNCAFGGSNRISQRFSRRCFRLLNHFNSLYEPEGLRDVCNGTGKDTSSS